MKKLEVILPDFLLRQVLVLIAEEANELHIYNIPEEPKALPAPEPKAKAKQRPKVDPNRPVPTITAREALYNCLAENDGFCRHTDFVNFGKALGFSDNALSSQASIEAKQGRLERPATGGYRLLRQPETPIAA